MNLTLVFLWKEWRAQRGILIAYGLLVWGCLALGLWLAPAHAWFDAGLGVHALGWFFTAGVIGVVGFVAPGLVRGEFVAKDDQFVRRLPGALGPAFAGKLLFLVLATLLLPLLGLLLGELYVTARGYDWNALFAWGWDGSVAMTWYWTPILAALALLLAPWVWAVGTWLPGGRMALGGTALLGLLLGVGVFAVLRQSPGLLGDFDWRPWLCALPPTGLSVAAVAWTKGRRGGGALRSARFGLATTAVLVLPGAVWIGAEAWSYHHPDLQRLATLHVRGLAPDGRYALAYGAGRSNYSTVPLRIDLATGSAQQLGGIRFDVTSEVLHGSSLLTWYAASQRHWLGHEEGAMVHVDLTTGVQAPLGRITAAGRPALPAALQQAARAEQRRAAPFRAPDGRAVWIEDDEVCFAAVDGAVERRPFPIERPFSLLPAGHAIRVFGKKHEVYDLTTGQVRPDAGAGAWCVRGVMLSYDKGAAAKARATAKTQGRANASARLTRWLRQTPGEAPAPCPALVDAHVLGLYDDDHLLAARRLPDDRLRQELFLYRPVDDTVVPLPVFGPLAAEWLDAEPLLTPTALLPRDPAGRLWLRARTDSDEAFLLVDVPRGSVQSVLPFVHHGGHSRQLCGWPDADHALLRDDLQIVRVHLATGAREVLFPRK